MQRLQTRAQFDAVLGHRALASTEHFALHCSDSLDALTEPMPLSEQSDLLSTPLAGLKQSAIGAMVPKRWARRAVTRNLIRRQIYSLAQHHLPHQPAQAYVVRLRRSFSNQRFVAASSELLRQAVREQLLALLSLVQSNAPNPRQTLGLSPTQKERL